MRVLVSVLVSVLAVACSQQLASEKAPESAGSEPYVLGKDEGEVFEDSRGRTTIIKVSPETGSQLLAMGTQDMPPGSAILVHKHDQTEEILYVTDGSGTLLLGDDRVDVEADTTVWVPPGTWHGIENPDSHMHVLWFVTPPGLDGFFREMFWHPGEQPKALSQEKIEEIAKKHDSVARPK